MDLAGLARNMVSNGKLRLAPRPPRVLDHYQTLPPAPKYIVRMKPVDYIGLYLIVIIASCVTVNWLYRIYL